MTNMFFKPFILAAMLSVSFFAETAYARNNEVFFPTSNEKLENPINLKDCKGIKIIEWKESPYSSLTKQKDFVFTKLNSKCKETKAKFIKYVKIKYNFDITDELDQTDVEISFLPANQHFDSDKDRNLNDPNRFSMLKTGLQWGHTNYTYKYMILRNDPLVKENKVIVDNVYFYRTFVHELSHLFGYYSRVRRNYLNNDKELDEDMANSFVSYMGYSSEIESAAKTASKQTD